MGTALGFSLIRTYSDRSGVNSSANGLMFHYQNKYSLAVPRYSGKTGFMLSTDVGKWITKVEDDARKAIRLVTDR